MDIQVGLVHKKTITVTDDLTAEALGSGLLPVFATPALVALIEDCAKTSIAPFLDEGWGCVGTLVHVEHVAATLVGKQVTCQTTITQVDRKRIVFEALVTDDAGVIGRGTHERFLIQKEAFINKLRDKK